MAFLQVQFFSGTLNMGVSVNVILPEASQGIGMGAVRSEELPKVLYLLHGFTDDHTAWTRRTSIERYAADYNLAVIMPAVAHSFYCNEVHGKRYWDFVSEELPKTMQQFFRLSDKPCDTFAAGLSMGGYGSMKLALALPERFGAAASFSGFVDVGGVDKNDLNIGHFAEDIFGELDKIKGSPNDLFYLMEQNKDAPAKPRLYVSCGTADFLYGDHRKFVPALKKNGWDVTAYEKPDEHHLWRFWDEEIAKFIRFIFGK